MPEDAEKAKIAIAPIPTDLKIVEKVEFAGATTGNLNLTGASVKDQDLSVPRLSTVLEDIFGTSRGMITYAGAFESESFSITGMNTVNAGDINVVCVNGRIKITSDNSPIQSVKLFDLQGRVVTLEPVVAANAYTIPAPAKGIYVIEILTKDARNVQKISVR